MAEKLTAAKPVTWRGKGDLPQAVWCTPPKGTLLVIELWSGISGLALALLSVGANFYAAAAETNPDARSCAQAVMPHIVHIPSVEALVAEDFRGLLTRRKPRAVLIGGGVHAKGIVFLTNSVKASKTLDRYNHGTCGVYVMNF